MKNSCKTIICRVLSAFIAVLTLFGCAFQSALAEENETVKETGVSAFYDESLEENYRAVRKTYSYTAYEGSDFTFSMNDILDDDYRYKLASGEDYDGAYVAVAQGENAVVSIDVPQDGLYAVTVDYRDDTNSVLPVKLGLKLDGAYPFYEMRNQLLESDWFYDIGEFPLDRYDNETVPLSVKVKKWYTKYLRDASAVVSEPFLLPLSKGVHSLEFICTEGSFSLGNITVGKLPSFAEHEAEAASGDGITVIPAEKPVYKNDSTIRPAAEYNVELSPYRSDKRVLNMLAGNSFAKGGQSVTYGFTVDKSGYYNIGFRYRQNSKSDFPVFRNVYIDNKYLDPRLSRVAFPYNNEFENLIMTDGETNGKFSIYLEEGKIHTLTVSVNLEVMAPYIDEVNTLIREINALSLEVIKLSGNNTEKYRDFDLDEYLPGLPERLTLWADKCGELYESLKGLAPGKKKIGEFSGLLVCQKQLLSLAEKPNDLPKRINELSKGQSSVLQYAANILESLYYSPLSLDEIYVFQDEELLPKGANIFTKVFEGIKRFINSFVMDSYETSARKNDDNLQVWVGRSRQYVEIMQKMADDGYNQSGIGVDLSIMPDQGKLVLANAAGKQPDVALGVGAGTPFELAVRGALLNLRDFDDCSEVTKRFQPGLLVPGILEDGLYSLPETTNFYVLFYRKDILGQLGLSVPDTMNEVKQLLPALNRQGMNFFSHVAGFTNKPFAATLPFIYQSGGSIYGDTASDITLDSDKSLDAISELTELFTIYNIPYEVPNFYQHFRSGSLPIGIGDFGTYNLLLNTAPEIANSWDIAPYPGYADESGRVDRSTTGASETCIIFKKTDKAKQSWEFLKWWTGTETQMRFAQSLQLSYGKEYMWNTANIEAFEQLPWNETQKQVILSQLGWINEAPRVPGSYMAEREISNALNAIILDSKNPRAEIDKAIKVIKKETHRKLEEFGYIKNNEVIKEFKIPQRSVPGEEK